MFERKLTMFYRIISNCKQMNYPAAELRSITISPFPLGPLPLSGNDETVSPGRGKGSRFIRGVSCPFGGRMSEGHGSPLVDVRAG
jgi:hypothetical protein